jgi:hypothetical protein
MGWARSRRLRETGLLVEVCPSTGPASRQRRKAPPDSAEEAAAAPQVFRNERRFQYVGESDFINDIPPGWIGGPAGYCDIGFPRLDGQGVLLRFPEQNYRAVSQFGHIVLIA